MIERLSSFVERLRQTGVPVSTSEAIDATSALGAIVWHPRHRFKSVLSATMVKNAAHLPVFESLFDIYFPASVGDELGEIDPDVAPDDMTKDLIDALMRMDLAYLEQLAAEAVRRFAGMEPGRPVGGRYYQWRVEQALRFDELTAQLASMLGNGGGGSGNGGSGQGSGGLSGRLATMEASTRTAELRRRVERIIRARLIAERGPDAMARALVRPLPEEVEFLAASSDDLAEMKRTVAVLARRLAARLAYKHHHTKHGRLDFRRTIRASLQSGGTPLETKHKHRVQRPELVILCDISGSVAAFSRFALALLYALAQHFRKIRSFAFIDGIDEVTAFFDGADLEDASGRIRTEAKVVWIDGHSDYGNAFGHFLQRYPDALTPRTTVLLLGDARSNFRAPRADVLHEIRQRSRKVYFLNPEPHRHWNTGDSIVAAYEQACDGVFECRNLRQLATFIERIA